MNLTPEQQALLAAIRDDQSRAVMLKLFERADLIKREERRISPDTKGGLDA